jgi:P2-related tail formation protein
MKTFNPQKPFTDHLPSVYKNNPGSQYLFGTADTLAASLYAKANSLRSFLDPAITPDNGLNFIARDILDLRSWFWSDDWRTDWKRKTIQNYPKLIKERGNKSLLSYLFTLYGLDARVKETGWVLNSSTFPIALGNNWDQVTIKISETYIASTPEYQMVQAIVKWFIPDLITVTITTI